MTIQCRFGVVDYWYDKHLRSWTVQKKDVELNQIGDAIYVATKAELPVVINIAKQLLNSAADNEALVKTKWDRKTHTERQL